MKVDYKISRIITKGDVTEVLHRAYEGDFDLVFDDFLGEEVETYVRSGMVKAVEHTLPGAIGGDRTRDFLNEELVPLAAARGGDILPEQVVDDASNLTPLSENVIYAA